MHRWPAAPKAAPTSWLMVYSLLASGMMTPWFLAPMLHCTRLPGHGTPPLLTVVAPPLVDVLARRVPAHEADRADVGVVADEVDGVMLAVDNIHHAVGAPWAGRVATLSHLVYKRRTETELIFWI